MKRVVTLFLVLVVGSSFAQVSYESSDFIAVDDTMLFSTMTLGLGQFDFDTAGVNVSWDFSGLAFENQETGGYFSPEDAGYRATWCLSNGIGLNCASSFEGLTNRARQNIDSVGLESLSIENAVAHEFLSSATLENRMIGLTANIENVGVPLVFDFEDIDTLYQFPFTFGDQDSSTSRVVLDFAPLPFVQSRNSKRVNQIEGWGSLLTPFGSFSQVLKMKTVIENKDTVFLDTVTVSTSLVEVEYKWWSKDFGLPVLVASGSQVGDFVTITNVRYLDSSRCVTPTAFFSYSPVTPVFDTLSQTSVVEFTNLSLNADSLVWDFDDGVISSEDSPVHTFTSSGLFNVVLRAYNTCVPGGGLADTLMFPVLVNDTTVVLGVGGSNKIGRLKVYPNPAKDVVRVSAGHETVLSVEVLSLDGRVLFQGVGEEIPILALPEGVYLAKVGTRSGFLYARFLRE